VTTNGGIRGTVLTVKDDVVILRVQPDGVKLEFVKSAIATVTTDEQPPEAGSAEVWCIEFEMYAGEIETVNYG